jgi:hypothetical protein
MCLAVLLASFTGCVDQCSDGVAPAPLALEQVVIGTPEGKAVDLDPAGGIGPIYIKLGDALRLYPVVTGGVSPITEQMFAPDGQEILLAGETWRPSVSGVYQLVFIDHVGTTVSYTMQLEVVLP